MRQSESPAVDVARRVKTLSAGRDFWPGFDPLQIPLAIYDGADTYLFGHPGVPDGFDRRGDGASAPLVYAGRHPRIVANTGTELDGVLTATLLVGRDTPTLSPDEFAAVAIHESFHVFQLQHRELWEWANEATMFLYPQTDADIHALRRQEVEALRRAVHAATVSERTSWAICFLKVRQQRFTKMDSDFTKYERSMEVIEGLAAYIEAMAADRHGPNLPADGFGPTDIRRGCYAVGHTLAWLLDAYSPGWKAGLAGQSGWVLDERLAAVLTDEPVDGVGGNFSEGELETFRRRGHDDVEHVLAERSARLHDFRNRPGQRLVVQAADGQPLGLAGFDPMNVITVDHGILHTRLLHLSNDNGRLEMMREGDDDVIALTEGVGPHPLYNGVRRVELVAGSDVTVVANDAEGTINVSGGGISAVFSPAKLEQAAAMITVTLET